MNDDVVAAQKKTELKTFPDKSSFRTIQCQHCYTLGHRGRLFKRMATKRVGIAMTFPAVESESIRIHHGVRNEASFTANAPIGLCIDTDTDTDTDTDVDRVDMSCESVEGCVVSEIIIISSLSSSSIPSESTSPKSEWKTNDDERGDGDNPCGVGGHVPNNLLYDRTISSETVGMNSEGTFNRGSKSLPPPPPPPPPSSSSSTRASEPESSDRGDDNSNSDDFSADEDCDISKPSSENTRTSGVWKEIVDDFDCSRGGDRKILRAIGRTATVNAVVAATAALGPIAAIAGYATGGVITARRLVGDGIAKENPKEVAKSLAVFGSATSASVAGQAITGAVAIGVLGVGLPLAGALAFGVGCVSGITAGALSEWGVDGVMKQDEEKETDDESKETSFSEAGVNKISVKDDCVEKILPASNTTTITKRNSFVATCGTWVNRQRERNRQRMIERENARRMDALATASKPQEKQKSNCGSSTESYFSSSTCCSDSGSSGGDCFD